MSNDIVKSQPSIIATVQDMQTMAQVFVKSGFFTDAADVSKAMVKIAAGREIGLEPFASMSGIHVIKGKVTYGANILAAKVKASGRYDYRVKEMSEKACRLMFYQRVDGKWEEIGPSDFTMEDARKAGTQNTDRFPRNMLFARAISNGVKWYCPDVTQGVTVYTPEDFGAVVNDDGVVESVDGKVVESEPPKPAQAVTYEQAAVMEYKTSSGKVYILGQLEADRLNWIIGNAKSEEIREAARVVLGHDFNYSEPIDDEQAAE